MSLLLHITQSNSIFLWFGVFCLWGVTHLKHRPCWDFLHSDIPSSITFSGTLTRLPPHPLWLCVFGWADPVVLSMWTFENINAYVCTLTTRSFHVLCKFQLEKKDKARGNNLIEEKISLFGFVSFSNTSWLLRTLIKL